MWRAPLRLGLHKILKNGRILAGSDFLKSFKGKHLKSSIDANCQLFCSTSAADFYLNLDGNQLHLVEEISLDNSSVIINIDNFLHQ